MQPPGGDAPADPAGGHAGEEQLAGGDGSVLALGDGHDGHVRMRPRLDRGEHGVELGVGERHAGAIADET